MCRLLAHLGRTVGLDHLLYGAPDHPSTDVSVGSTGASVATPAQHGGEHAFVHQSYAPRFQDLGRTNADGWGVGWWDRTIRPEPARYRTATPMWADARFREIAPLVRTGAAVAAIRNASPGAPVEETGNAPFMAGSWLFAHNGFVEGFRDGLGVELRREVSPARERGILGAADSEVLFALVLDRLDRGAPMAEALVAVLDDVRARAGGRFNFVLGDGHTIVLTRCGNSLFTHPDGIVASEPLTDDGSWHEVPDGSLVVLDDRGPTVTPL